MKIKLCGMMRPEDIKAANEVKPDYIGFVFANTRRLISREMAAEFKSMLSPEIEAVGVYVNEDVDIVASDFKNGIIDIAQLHGQETLDYILGLKEKAPGVKIIKAVRASSKEDVDKSLELPVDFLLFDTYKKGVLGGTGELFNWDMVKDVKREYFLAGGLDAGNLAEAVKVGAYGLDLSSGIETDGKKDPEKMRQVVEIVRGGMIE